MTSGGPGPPGSNDQNPRPSPNRPGSRTDRAGLPQQAEAIWVDRAGLHPVGEGAPVMRRYGQRRAGGVLRVAHGHQCCRGRHLDAIAAVVTAVARLAPRGADLDAVAAVVTAVGGLTP